MGNCPLHGAENPSRHVGDRKRHRGDGQSKQDSPNNHSTARVPQHLEDGWNILQCFDAFAPSATG